MISAISPSLGGSRIDRTEFYRPRGRPRFIVLARSASISSGEVYYRREGFGYFSKGYAFILVKGRG